MTKTPTPTLGGKAEGAPNGLKHYFASQSIRDYAVAAFIALITLKLVLVPWNVNIDRFSFTDLLALLLALFSVGLSVVFYKMAESGSARFFDQNYEFIKDASELLGRIEVGVGHIAVQNVEMQRTLSGREINVQEKWEGVSVVKEAIVKKAVALNNEQDPEEKERLMTDLQSITHELSDARQKLVQAQKELTATKIANFTGGDAGVVLDFILRLMYENHRAAPPEELEPAYLDGDALKTKFREVTQGLSAKSTAALLSEEFITEAGELTEKGVDMLRRMRRFNNNY